MMIFLFVLLFPLLASAQFTTPVIDDFDRANEDPIVGWTTGITGDATSPCIVSGNVLIRGAAGSNNSCYINAGPYTADHEIYATFPNANNHATGGQTRLYFCLVGGIGTAAVDGYALEFHKQAGTDHVEIARMDNGDMVTPLEISSRVNLEVVSGDRLGVVRMANGDMKVYHSTGVGAWTLILEDNDTTYNCTNSRIGVHVSGNTFQIEDFGGGSVVMGGGGPGGSAHNHSILMPR